MAKKLFIPGPVDVSPDVAAKMSEPMIGHRSAEYSQLHGETIGNLKKILFTENEVFIGATSSTGFMEAAVRNCVKDKALHVINGAFSDKWAKISVACGKKIERADIAWGRAVRLEEIEDQLSSGEFDTLFVTHNETSTAAMTPLEGFSKICVENNVTFCVDAVSSVAGVPLKVDELGIDVLVTGTQKCFAVAPGLAVTSVSPRALEMSEEMSGKGIYFDYKVYEKSSKKNNTPMTPPIPQINALNYQIDKILTHEGLENRFARHRELADYTRSWAKKNFELFTEDWCSSDTVSCIKNSINADLTDISEKLSDRGYLFSNGYGKLKGEAFRIAHMGDRTLEELKEYIDVLNELMGL